MTRIYQDVRHALRSLGKQPAFSAVVVGALALCIGANTAIFSVVDSALLRGLPFRDSNRLVAVSEKISAIMAGRLPFSAPDYIELRRRNHSFEALGVYIDHHYELSGIDRPDRLVGTRVSASLFPMLGISPMIGRNFTEKEDQDSHRVAILSAALWRSKFGGDRNIIGKALVLDRTRYTVVGVLPTGVIFPLHGPAFNSDPAQVFVPISFTKAEREGYGNMYNDSVIGRLRPGVTLEQARADVRAVTGQLYNEIYSANLHGSDFMLGSDVITLREEVLGKVQPILLILFGAVGLVLLIGCADVANLMLTRAIARRREMSIRAALGASTGDLVRQTLTESAVLAVTGGALGLLLSYWATGILAIATSLNLPVENVSASNMHVFAFTAGLSILTALLFGLVPAVQASKADVNEGLREGARGQTVGRKQGRMLSALVIAQFALALVLLVGAGLLVRSFSRLLATNPGFRADHILTMSVSLPASAYQTGPEVRGFYERLQRSLATLPGVKDASVATSLPLSISEHRSFSIEAQLPRTLSAPRGVAHIWPLGDFFQTMGIPLLRGRFLDQRDSLHSMPVVVVNATMARWFWPGQDPIGKRLKWGEKGSKHPWMTIVGVVGDVKQSALSDQIEPETYTSYEQLSDDELAENVTGEMRDLKVAVRTAVDPLLMAPAVEQRVHQLDSSLPVTNVESMDSTLHQSTRSQRFDTLLLTAFAAFAILLAALGIAGVLAYSVAQRVSEIGLRLALGAHRTDVLKLVIARGMQMALVGTAVGIACSLASSRVMSSMLFDTSPYDTATLIAAPAFLCLVAMVSILAPALRAAAIDPIKALRSE